MEYVGLDFEAGDGVDIVITGRDDWNVPDDYFDLVMASSVLEHDPEFWKTFVAMCRKTKSGGHLYISAPSNGTVHRYPKDYWRFYPDAGLALCETARAEGLHVTLVESFVAERESDGWNDFCAIFRIGEHAQGLNSDFVYARVPYTNAIDWRSADVVNSIEAPEDARLLRTARDQGHILRLEGEALRQQLDGMRDAHLREKEAFAATQARLTVEMTELETARRTLEANLLDAHVRQQAAVATIEGLKNELAETIDMLEAERAQAQAHHREIETLIDQKFASDQRLNERFREIAGLTRLIQERDQQIAREEAKAEWLRQMVAVVSREMACSTLPNTLPLIPT
jgi:SAM-dependent methyltransferase